MKKKNLNWLLALLAALALVFAFAGCADNGAGDGSSDGGSNTDETLGEGGGCNCNTQDCTGGSTCNVCTEDLNCCDDCGEGAVETEEGGTAFSGKTYTYDADTSAVTHAGTSSAILDKIEIAFGEGTNTAFTATVYYAAHSSDFVIGAGETATASEGAGGTGYCTFGAGTTTPAGTCGVFEATFTGTYSVNDSTVTLTSLAAGTGTTLDGSNNVTSIALTSSESGLTLSGAGESPAYKLFGTGTTYAYDSSHSDGAGTYGTDSATDSVGIDIFAVAATSAEDDASVGTLCDANGLKTTVVFTTD